MSYIIWILVNVLLVLAISMYIWIFRIEDTRLLMLGQVLAQISLLLFIINLNMYFIFLVIRKTKVRKVKIILAKLSRRMMKGHISIAIFGAILIIFHGEIMLLKLGASIGYTHSKIITGEIAILFLVITLFAGYLRHKKSSGRRRKFHFLSAFLFLIMVLLHMLMKV
ncbi:hypothetical protein ACLM5H_15365 [Fredinandcohnia humi]